MSFVTCCAVGSVYNPVQPTTRLNHDDTSRLAEKAVMPKASVAATAISSIFLF